MKIIEKEFQIVGFLIITPAYVPEAIQKLKSEHFLDENCSKIYKIITNAFSNSETLDEILITEKFGDGHYVNKIIAGNTITPISFTQYLKDIRQASNDRKTIAIAESLKEAINNANYDEVESLKHQLLEVSQETSLVPRTLKDITEQYVESYFTEEEKGYPTGFETLDLYTSGLQKGNLITISARTGVGKTNICLNMAINLANQGRRVLFITLEMLEKELIDRLIAMIGSVSAVDVRARRLDQNKLTTIISDLNRLNIKILFGSDITSLDVFTSAYIEKITNNLDVLFVDYLGRLSDKIKTSDEEKLSRIARNLKNTALKLHIPVITPVQIDKISALSKKDPQAEHAKGSSSISHESDLCLALVKSDKMNEVAKMYITKNRHGQTGIINLHFDMQQLLFTEVNDQAIQEGKKERNDQTVVKKSEVHEVWNQEIDEANDIPF